jgi:hypothetical protein
MTLPMTAKAVGIKVVDCCDMATVKIVDATIYQAGLKGDHLLAFNSRCLLPSVNWLGVVQASPTGVCHESPNDNCTTRGWHWEAVTWTSTMGMGRGTTRNWARTHHRGALPYERTTSMKEFVEVTRCRGSIF